MTRADCAHAHSSNSTQDENESWKTRVTSPLLSSLVPSMFFLLLIMFVNSFVDWCDRHFLLLNVKKTKELIIDFRKDTPPKEPLIIKDEEVEIVSTYKYLGITVDDKLNWKTHISNVYSKINQRLYFLRKLKSFHVDNVIMSLFYKATMESLVTFCITCWGGNARGKERERLDGLIKKAGKITRSTIPSSDELYLSNCSKKINSIIMTDEIEQIQPN